MIGFFRVTMQILKSCLYMSFFSKKDCLFEAIHDLEFECNARSIYGSEKAQTRMPRNIEKPPSLYK